MGVSAEVVAAVIALEDSRGRLDPNRVIEVAADTESPLHGCFEWDDSVAGQKWRLEQARELIREIRVEVIYQQVPVNVIRYVHNPDNDVNQCGYISTPRITRANKALVMLAELERVAAVLHRALQYATVETSALPRGMADTLQRMETDMESMVGQLVAMSKRRTARK